VESNEHVNFHFSESSADINSLIVPLGAQRRKGGKQALKRTIVEKSLEKQEEEAPKSFWLLWTPFVCLWFNKGSNNLKLGDNQVVESHCGRFRCHRQCPKWGFCQGHHQGKVARLFHREGDQNQVGATVVAPSRMYMETQCFETDKEWIHFTQTLLKEHMWEW
jgi:hypothetical protein